MESGWDMWKLGGWDMYNVGGVNRKVGETCGRWVGHIDGGLDI